VYLKLITLCLLSSSISFAQTTSSATCLDQLMEPLLTPTQKQFISTSANPVSEKVRVYTQFHREKYQDFATQCRNQESAQQTQTKTQAVAAQKTATQGAATSAQNNAALLTGVQQAAVAFATTENPKPKPAAADASGNQSAVSQTANNRTDNGKKTSTPTTAQNRAEDEKWTAVDSSINNSTSTGNVNTGYGGEDRSDKNGSDLESDNAFQKRVEADVSSKEYKNQFDMKGGAEAVTQQLGPNVGKIGNELASLGINADDFPAQRKTITQSAEQQNGRVKELLSSVERFKSQIPDYPATGAELTTLSASVETYLASKKVCTASAEKAELLCVESPGAEKVKILMDVAGPFLAAVSSASKSCSSLNKVTALAGAGLMIAKGVCATSKFMCDSACGKAATELKKIQLQIQKVQTTFISEFKVKFDTCSTVPICTKVQADGQMAKPAITSFTTYLKPEMEPATPGTSPQMVAQCGGLVKELGIMAINVLGVLKARDSAKKCEEQLTTAGAGDVSKQQYCEIPANASSDLCKCEKNSMAQGCPGALVSNSSSTGDQQGSVIRNSSGVSGFASVTNSTVPTSPLAATGGSSAGSKSPNSARYGGIQGSSGSGSGGGSAGGNSGESVGSNSGEAVAKAAGKKWDFGAFGSESGGGSSSRGKNSGINGSGVGEKDMDALKRKIASDQFAAEVSPASGKSNWEKVKRMYLFKGGSFIGK
jgi:hypothetical protein